MRVLLHLGFWHAGQKAQIREQCSSQDSSTAALLSQDSSLPRLRNTGRHRPAAASSISVKSSSRPLWQQNTWQDIKLHSFYSSAGQMTAESLQVSCIKQERMLSRTASSKWLLLPITAMLLLLLKHSLHNILQSSTLLLLFLMVQTTPTLFDSDAKL